MERNYFLLRRLHSLSGIIPIGVFLVVHLITNSSLLWGKFALRGKQEERSLLEGGVYYFQKEVAWINNEVPHLLLIELSLWIGIAFHSILGVYYAMSGKSNSARYAYQGNQRYTWQRISGYVGIFFIFYHVATLRWGWSFLVPGGTKWDHNFAASTLATALRGGETFTLAGIAVSFFYFVGITLLVFHFANGLWTAAITWGLTISAQSQKRFGYACAGLGGGLMLAAWASLAGALLLSPEQMREVERLQIKPPAATGTSPSVPAE